MSDIAASPEVAVSLQRLTLAYGSTVAVPELDLDIHRGELIALLGPSGCGKTTTMRAIAGLMSPRSGKIVIDGTDVSRVPANKRGVGLVFQSYALFPHLSGFENVAFGLRIKKRSAAEITRRVEASLELVGMSQFATRKPAELSGGQQQRLSLARSLVMEPKVLLLDEPLSNLDARLRLEMRTELQRLQRQTGITMVFVTHDQNEALALSDRIVLMSQGCIEQIGSPEVLYSQPNSIFAADFMGFENIFEVANSNVSDKASILRNDHGKLKVDYPINARHIAWRPGAIVVGQGAHTGTVAAVSFAGEQREYVIDTEIGVIKANVDASDQPVLVGQSIHFDLPLASARLLND